ncbi:unnamed protein product, partial [Amoebophrya sp. A25]|eukprot:GSA25T00024918001.1
MRRELKKMTENAIKQQEEFNKVRLHLEEEIKSLRSAASTPVAAPAGPSAVVPGADEASRGLLRNGADPNFANRRGTSSSSSSNRLQQSREAIAQQAQEIMHPQPYVRQTRPAVSMDAFARGQQTA